MLLRSVVAAVAWVGPIPQAGDEPTSTHAAHDAARAGELARVYVHTEGIDRQDLLEAVRLRVPHLDWVVFDAPDNRPGATQGEPNGGAAVAQVRVVGERVAVLSIVVDDGRAFDRELDIRDTVEADRIRVVASNIANLIAGIEAGTVAPDRSDVPLPVPPEPAGPKVCPDPAPPCPTPPNTGDPPAPTQPDPDSAPPRTSVGVTASLPVTLGLGEPADADRFAAWGGELGLQVRLRGGATFLANFRGAGRATLGGVRMLRGRVAVGAGYTLRRGALELSSTAWVTVEPWAVRLGGMRASFVAGPARRRVLVGGGVRVAPGLRWRSHAGALAVRVGPYSELTVSGSPGDALAVPRIVLPSEEASRLRAGGVEASLGVQCVFWFDVGRPTAPGQ